MFYAVCYRVFVFVIENHYVMCLKFIENGEE
jgi:hypothetical protein